MNRSEDFLERQLKRMKKLSSVEEETVREDIEKNSINFNFDNQTVKHQKQEKSDQNQKTVENTLVSGARKSFMKSADTVVAPPKKRYLFAIIIIIFIIFGAIVGLVLLGGLFSDDTTVPEDIVQIDVRDSVVGVMAELVTTPTDGTSSFGTAFAVTNRDFITNKHVIANSIECPIAIYHPKWENNSNTEGFRRVILKCVSDQYDLAWLQLEYTDPTIYPLEVFYGKVMQGEEVYTLGYPAYTLGNSKTAIPEITYDKGVIKAVNRVVEGNECYEMSATINGGNSGGPLFNLNGQVIGVNTFGYDHYENCFFAIKIELVEKAFPELWAKMKKAY
jgi:S1-C subfamily serine protease